MKNGDNGNDSTRYEGSERKDFDNQSAAVISEIELKF